MYNNIKKIKYYITAVITWEINPFLYRNVSVIMLKENSLEITSVSLMRLKMKVKRTEFWD